MFGLGPIGQMACPHRPSGRGHRVIGVDLVPERLAMAARRGAIVIDAGEVAASSTPSASTRVVGAPTASIDAVGMEAHGSPVAMAVIGPRRICCPTARRAH